MSAENFVTTNGFYMPAENAPQDMVVIAWPERPDNWREAAKPAQHAFLQVALAINETTPVLMLATPAQFASVEAIANGKFNVLSVEYNDAWLRDTGPTYLINQKGERCAIDWIFNAWGGQEHGLYPDWQADDNVAEQVARFTSDSSLRAPLVLEGGSIHVDGEGTLYTTEECLLHPGRNPDLTKSEIETILKGWLKIEKIIWLPDGLYNDETNGHIDNILHVVKPGEVVLTWCDDADDPQYAISRTALEVLENEKDAKGRNITVHKLPMPGPLFITEEEASGLKQNEHESRDAGDRMAASYSNFLVTNGQIVYPLLDESTDGLAAQILSSIFPDYKITGVPTREILLGGGNIHCITQQVPSKTSK